MRMDECVVTEDEVRYKILQALSLTNGKITASMLQAHLTSKVPTRSRDAVLTRMVREGVIKVSETAVSSYHGRVSYVQVVERVETA